MRENDFISVIFFSFQKKSLHKNESRIKREILFSFVFVLTRFPVVLLNVNKQFRSDVDFEDFAFDFGCSSSNCNSHSETNFLKKISGQD
jgi:hypothetical protein